mgnify:CR=1 FL=1
MLDMLRLASIGEDLLRQVCPDNVPLVIKIGKVADSCGKHRDRTPRSPPGRLGRSARRTSSHERPVPWRVGASWPSTHRASQEGPRLVPSSGEGRGGGPTAQTTGVDSAFTWPAVQRPDAWPRDQRDGSHNATSGRRQRPAAGPAGGLTHLEADTRTLRVADTSGCRLTFTV